MTIESDIVAWALGRPGWQQEVLVALANGGVFDDAKVNALVDRILEPDSAAPSNEAKELSIKAGIAEQVRLTQVANLRGVNALVEDQTLSFAPTGLTVIYGNNGSGKSGYARLIKSAVKAYHLPSVLGHAFKAESDSPTAELTYTVADREYVHRYPGAAAPELHKMSFYDRLCGDKYVSSQSSVMYRPSALSLFDGLSEVCDLASKILQERINESDNRALNLGLPPDTKAAEFVRRLNAETTSDQIDHAISLSLNANEQFASLAQEEARLLASNPEIEKMRLSGQARQLLGLSFGIDRLLTELSAERTSIRVAAKTKATELRAAANLAASISFDGEPVRGVGSETWRALWSAASEFSRTEAYSSHQFPATDHEAACVLCQQPLSDLAKDRLDRFNQYMTDTTARDAQEAERNCQRTLDDLRSLVIQPGSGEIAGLKKLDAQLGTSVQDLFDRLTEQRNAIVEHLVNDAILPAILPKSDIADRVRDHATQLQDQAEVLDLASFNDQLSRAKRDKIELQASIKLSESRTALIEEVTRLKTLDRLRTAKAATKTSSITVKATALANEYVTNRSREQFTNETERMSLQNVTLNHPGGRKGKLNQQPGLRGAVQPGATAIGVLSEGEQTALGLAGFFTEAMLDESKSALIFDDPVTSLDHVRRGKVAARLVEFAQDRQVIVFTHDVSFIVDLRRAVDADNVRFTERSIERLGDQPGACRADFPWKAKDCDSRINELSEKLQKLKKERQGLQASDWEERTASWAGLLSEVWERCVGTDIAGHLFDRGTLEVRISKFRLLVKINEDDNKDFQEGYRATSTWARRHDKSPDTNYVAPEPPELQKELERIKQWRGRLKSYRA